MRNNNLQSIIFKNQKVLLTNNRCEVIIVIRVDKLAKSRVR
jgi:hypothetical protein